MINSIATSGCSSTNYLKTMEVGDVFYMEKPLYKNQFEIFKASNSSYIQARTLYRNWAIPFSIDFISNDNKGSVQGLGEVFNLGNQLTIKECSSNNGMVTWNNVIGYITLKKFRHASEYSIYMYPEEKLAICRIQSDWTTVDVLDPKDETVKIASFKRTITPQIERWELLVLTKVYSFDYRMLFFLINFISYNVGTS
ncbi:hypothetical protein ABK040_003766 [Willaertia magna]